MLPDFKDVTMCILESVNYHAFIGWTWLNSRLEIYTEEEKAVLEELRAT